MNKKLLLKLSLAVITSALAAQAAMADGNAVRKRGFFESLFGSFPSHRKSLNRPSWFDRRGDQVRGDYGNGDNPAFYRNPNNYADGLDEPAAIPGLGMGNPPYIAPKLLLIADPAFAKLTAGDVQSQAVLSELTDPQSKIRAPQDERQPILDFYKKTSFKPLWITAGAPSDRAKAVLAFATKVADDGLDPLNYIPAGFSSFDELSHVGSDPHTLAQFDIAMTAAALKLARQISGGQFDPNRLSLYNDITAQTVDANTALNVLAYSPYPDAYLRDLAPKSSAYAAMKSELAKLRANQEPSRAAPIAEGKTVKLGRSDPRIITLRQRLAALNFLDAAYVSEDDLLDTDVSDSLKKFQASAELKPSGQLDAATVKSLNRDDNARNIQRLVENMERVRWLPKSLGNRYVFVNQAAFEVLVMDKEHEVWRSAVIVGKPMTQTAAFHDEMETVVFNPSWGVPQSIIVNEYLKKLRYDPAYLDRQGFKVISPEGRVVSSSSVHWGAYGNKPPYGVQQPPGPENALGELKFLFPNKHDIYMHDTPSKNLFAETTRAFSHGCVRVENPRDFATVLLGWDRSRVDAEVDGGDSHSVKLPHKVPVHITYFTAWPDSSGKMMYYNDIYGRDEAMKKALASTAAMRDSLLDQKLVQK